MRCDPHDEHPAVTTARHLRATADTWPDLVRALTPAPRQPGAGRVSGTSGRPLPINVQVHDVMADISAWAYFWARALLDETDDWTLPPDPLDTPALLRALSLRVGHWIEHPDPLIARAFTDEVEDVRRRAERTAHPTGVRKVPTHMGCVEDGCPGSYQATIPPDSRWTEIPDLRCDRDRTHTITPDELRRLQRWQQRHEVDPERARAYLAQLRAQQPYRDLARAVTDQPPRYNNRARTARRA